MSLIDRLGPTFPIIQAPMAGVSTAKLAAEVSNAGGLGSIAIGAMECKSTTVTHRFDGRMPPWAAFKVSDCPNPYAKAGLGNLVIFSGVGLAAAN